MASAEEPNFWGKFPRDGIPENKAKPWRMGDGGGSGPSGWSMSASGLAAVWAEENSRDAILKAFRRREVYATTGPRIGARVFGGWDFTAAEAEAPSISEAGYARGVPMGGELSVGPKGAAPTFLVQVMRDPKSANLDRVQVIKGWIDPGGKTHERVYNVAWSGARTLDATGGLAPVGNTVDPETGRYTNDIGSSQFSALWRDPDFDPAQPAFYYVRALEIPTPRHSLFDALALGVDPKTIEGPWWIQERAYTSPIWYTP